MAMRRTLAIVLVAFLLAGCTSADPDGGADPSATAGAATIEPESGILAGTLTATDPLADQPIVVASGHGRFAVTLVLIDNLPETSLGLNLTGPDGRSDEVRTSPTLYAFPGLRPTMSFADPMAGAWASIVELRSGASADYEVHWCADDAANPGPQDNLACQRDFS